MDKFEEIISRLNKTTLEKVRLLEEKEDIRQPVPSLGINRVLRGGLRYGTINQFWGNAGGGKSSFALGTIGLAQKQDATCAIIDSEKSADKDWATSLGADPSQIIEAEVTSMRRATDAAVDLLQSGVNVLVFDSISGLTPGSYYDDKGRLKNVDDTNQIGQFSKDSGKLLYMISDVMSEDQLVILISQVRTNINSYGGTLGPMGGKALEHYITTSIKFWSSSSAKEALSGDIYEGDFIFKESIGRKVTWTIDKERGPGMNATDEFNFFYNGEHVGVDQVGELLDLGERYGVVSKTSQGWYTIGEKKVQGKQNAAAYLRSMPEEYERLKGELLG